MPDLSTEDLYAFLNGVERSKREPVVNGLIDARDSGVRALGVDAGFAFGRGAQKGSMEESERAHQQRMHPPAAPTVDPAVKAMVESGDYHRQVAQAERVNAGLADDFIPRAKSGLTPADIATNKRLAKTHAAPLTSDHLAVMVNKAGLGAVQGVKEAEVEDGDSYLAAPGALNPDRANKQPDPAIAARDEEVEGVRQFFSPEAEARRAKVPQYWNSPAGKARLKEMEQKRQQHESRKQDFASLNRK